MKSTSKSASGAKLKVLKGTAKGKSGNKPSPSGKKIKTMC
jgi:hypothetical protein